MVVRRGTAKSDTLFGTIGKDQLFGGAGNDVIYGGKTSNWFHRDAADVLVGGAGRDRLYGGNGNDRFLHSQGPDSFYGGAGRDVLDYSKAREFIEIELGGQAAFNHGAARGDLADSIEVLIGTRFDDRIEGNSNFSSTIYGGGGKDEIYGGFVADHLSGGNGNDTIWGWEGNDRLIGGNGHDDLYGGDGNDILTGGNGRDELHGGQGADTVYGGAGADILWLTDSDQVYGGRGADQFEIQMFGFGVTTIKDFSTRSGDRIILPGSDNYDNLEDLLAVATERDGNTTIRFFSDSTLVLEGVKMAQLSADDFFFG